MNLTYTVHSVEQGSMPLAIEIDGRTVQAVIATTIVELVPAGTGGGTVTLRVTGGDADEAHTWSNGQSINMTLQGV